MHKLKWRLLTIQIFFRLQNADTAGARIPPGLAQISDLFSAYFTPNISKDTF